MKLVKIKISELKNFISSELYQKLDIKPITSLRVNSYIANPRANKDDIVLYFFHKDDELVAFRTVFADIIFQDNKPIKFAWCSGVWVSTKHRGQKLWKTLLDEVKNDWNNKLMSTNYANIIEPLYLNSGFNIFKQRSGTRYYLYPNFKSLLGERKGFRIFKSILPLFSCVAKIKAKKKVKKFSNEHDIKLVVAETIDTECQKLIEIQKDKSFFQRDIDELNWILEKPWICSSTNENISYPFSFENIPNKTEVVKVYSNSNFIGCIIYSIVKNRMKVLYHYSEPNNINVLTDSIIKIAHQSKVEFLTINDVVLIESFNKKKNAFIFSKPFSLNVLSTIDFEIDNSIKTFDGDGDNCFT